MKRIPVVLLVLVAITGVIAPWLLGSGHALAAAPGACADASGTERFPGVKVQSFEHTDVTGALAGLPDRIETALGPGERGSFCVGFHNRSGATVDLDLDVTDVGADRAGVPTIVAPGEAEFGAAAWLELPETTSITLEHGELARIEVRAEVPLDTTGGSSYASIIATAAPDPSSRREGTQIGIVPSVAVQLFFDVPGGLDQSGEIVDVRSPRVVWWDGLGVGDLPILDKLRGRGTAPIRFRWKNTGSVTARVSGAVRIESSLGGRDVATLETEKLLVLRGSTRSFSTTWKRDIPIAGRFTPTVRIYAGNGVVVEEKLPAIWVIPAWWYLLLLGIAIGIPLWLRRRSKRRYRELLERVVAAEQREVSVHSDEDWEDEDSWGDRH